MMKTLIFAGLSSFDLVYLVVGIAIFGLPALSDYYHKKLLHYVVPICFGFGHIGRVGSVFITMSVTIERYFAIVHPLKHFSGKRMLLITPMILSVLYNIPKFFEFQWSEVRKILLNITPNMSHKNQFLTEWTCGNHPSNQ